MINFDTISIACALREMEQAIVGSRVERIAQPSAHATQWTLFARGEKHTIRIETDAVSSRMHLTHRGRQSPTNPPAFCMLLRKLLGGAWLEGIDRPQGMGERIACLHFAAPQEGRRYRLMVELMGRHGNQILLDENDTVLGSVKRVTPQMSRFREVRAGLTYSLPPRQSGARRNLFAPGAGNDLSEQSFAALDEAEKWVNATFTGASPLMVREGLARIPRGEQEGASAAGELTSESVWYGLSNLLNYVRLSDYSPVLLTDALGRITGAYPIVLRTLPAAQQPLAISFSQAVDEASDALEQRSTFEGEKAALVSALTRARRIFASELLDIDEGLANAERAAEYRLAGELIKTNLTKIRPGDDAASLLDYVSGEEVEIELDPSLGALDNAKRYFVKYHKAEEAAVRLQERRERVEAGANRIEEALPRAEAAGSIDAVQALVEQLEDIQELFQQLHSRDGGADTGKKQPEPPYAGYKIRTYHSVDGWEILVGETAESNDYLTTRVASPSDIWLHARAQVSAHAVIRSRNRPAAVSAAAIRYAAEQVAKRSTSKHSRLVPVDYTLRKYVRKPRGSKPGAVLYSREKTIDVAPDAVAASRRDAEARL